MEFNNQWGNILGFHIVTPILLVIVIAVYFLSGRFVPWWILVGMIGLDVFWNICTLLNTYNEVAIRNDHLTIQRGLRTTKTSSIRLSQITRLEPFETIALPGFKAWSGLRVYNKE